MSFLFRVFWNALGLVIAATLVSSVSFESPVSVGLAAFGLGVVNALIRPVLFFLTLPLTILTLGLFTLVLNALMVWLIDGLVPGFNLHGFWDAFWTALIVSIVSFFGSLIAGRSRPRPMEIDSHDRNL